jgi:hypothetical protein
MPSSSSQLPTIESDSITFNKINQHAKSINSLDLSGYSAVTVEVRAKLTNKNATQVIFEHSPNWNNNAGGFGMSPNIKSYTYLENSCHTNHGAQNAGQFRNYQCNVTDMEYHTITNTFSSKPDSGRLFYFDAEEVAAGVIVKEDNKPDTVYGDGDSNVHYYPFRDDFFYLALRGDAPNVASAYKLQSLRIYNRKLSSAEICQNAWADYNRFGGTAPSCTP